ncbi:hypothetical protein [Nitrospira sp. M1]
MSEQKDKREAFVVMPFDESFDAVYENLIHNTFSEAGFHVYRGDDITSQQNILRDVVTALITADIIVADLTDSNPNVYYELGLAHALKKPVVLLTQDIGSIPFDLRPYRIIEYDTRFDRFKDAKERLATLANQIARNEIIFGNPVMDFGGEEALDRPMLSPSKLSTATSNREVEKPGYLDCLIEVEEGFEELTKIIEELREHVTEIGKQATVSTPKLEKAARRNNVRQARDLLRSLAKQYEVHHDELKLLNAKFRERWTNTGNALEIVLTQIPHTNTPENQDMPRLIASMQSIEQNAQICKDSLVSLIDSMNNLPPMERSFDKTKRELAEQLNGFVDNVDQVISLSIRVRAITGQSN